MLKQFTQGINNLLTLQQGQFSFKESEFTIFKQEHSQRLLDNFFDMALLGITVAFLFRVLILKSKNAILDLILPLVIMMVISLFYYINKNTSQMKHYFHIVLIPLVGLLTARKTISQNAIRFFLNESFASWLIMMIFGSFSSPQQWYQVVGINCFCFFAYITIVFRQYGFQGIGNDFYVHITTTIIFSACLIRMNELNLRNSFNLLSLSKIQEKKWQSVLTLMTDGVLIMQHSENEKGILLINSSLQKIFGKQIKIEQEKDNSENHIHTCRKNKNIKNAQNQDLGIQNFLNIDDKLESQKQQNQKSMGISIALNINKSLCIACEFEIKKQNQELKEKNTKIKQKENLSNKIRFNEKKVEPMFDNLFRTVQFKIVYSEKNKSSSQNNQKKVYKEIQFMNDFICKQLEYFQKHHIQGYSENFLLKVFDPNRIIELNIIKLDSESQVLFLFKEVSIYNRLSKARTTEKFSNILINSIAHNLFTPLNAMIQLTKSMSDMILGINEMADKNVQMIGICLQQLVFTTHNILEMSKIRQCRFSPNNRPTNIFEKTLCILEFFKDDMKFRETEYELKIKERVKDFMIILDDSRFSIVLYNLISNGVKHTSGGLIKISMKIINHDEFNKKTEKIQIKKNDENVLKKNSIFNNQNSIEEQEISSSESEQEIIQTAIKDGNKVDILIQNNLQDKLYLQISVSDTGVGIDHDQKKKCFKLFGNLKIKQDVNQGGMGLGLASASLICKALGGEIHLIRSEKNEGSKFQFILPITLGGPNIPNKKYNEDSSSAESSNDGSSNSNGQNDIDNFEKKKAQIIENIRKKQQQKIQNDSDQSESDESFESESSQDAILQEYREKQRKDQIQSCDVNKESSQSDKGSFDESNEEDMRNENTIQSYYQQKQQISNLCKSKLEINNQYSSQNFNNNIQDSAIHNQNVYVQQSIFDQDNQSNFTGFQLKQNAQILKQNFDDLDEKEKKVKILQRINPFQKSSNPGQMSINTIELFTTNFIDRKNNSDTPSSPKSSKIFKGKIDDSFIDFLNNSQNNHQIPYIQSQNGKNIQVERQSSNIQKISSAVKNSLIQNFEKRTLTMEQDNQINHYSKNPLVKHINEKSQFIKIQDLSQEDDQSQKNPCKQSKNKQLSLVNNLSLNNSVASIDKEIQIILNTMNSGNINLYNQDEKYCKTIQIKKEVNEFQQSQSNQILNIVTNKKGKFYFHTIQKQKSQQKKQKSFNENSKSQNSLSPIHQASSNSQNLKPIIEQSYLSSQTNQQASKQCIETFTKEKQEQFKSQDKQNISNIISAESIQENKKKNLKNNDTNPQQIFQNVQSSDSLSGKFNFKNMGSQVKSYEFASNVNKKNLKHYTQGQKQSNQQLTSNRNSHEISLKPLNIEKLQQDQESLKKIQITDDNKSNIQSSNQNKRKKILLKQKTQYGSMIKSNFQSSQAQNSKSECQQKQSLNIYPPCEIQQNSPQVLIVDDTVFNIQILQMIFQQKYNIVVDQAVSGEEAIMKCKKRIDQNIESYKLILMDINMPEMDGVVATNRIRQFNDQYVQNIQQKDYIIIAHTAIPEDQFGDYKSKGFDGFLQKPIDHDQLLRFLKKIHLK